MRVSQRPLRQSAGWLARLAFVVITCGMHAGTIARGTND